MAATEMLFILKLNWKLVLYVLLPCSSIDNNLRQARLLYAIFHVIIVVFPAASVHKKWVKNRTFDPRGWPHSRPVVITILKQIVPSSVRPYVRPSVPKLQNQATITAGRFCGVAEWIIDDSCLAFTCFWTLTFLVTNVHHSSSAFGPKTSHMSEKKGIQNRKNIASKKKKLSSTLAKKLMRLQEENNITILLI